MTDLPKLKVGCGIVWQTTDIMSELGAYPLVRCVRGLLCPTCQHNLDVVKAHAADYHSLLNVTPVGIARIQVEAARDAVLKLTDEIKLKDLEVEGKTI